MNENLVKLFYPHAIVDIITIYATQKRFYVIKEEWASGTNQISPLCDSPEEAWKEAWTQLLTSRLLNHD